MKENPKYLKIEEDMRAGRITLEGFLGNDTRHLSEILITDDAAVKRLNLTHQDIAEKLAYYAEKGKAGLGELCTVDNHFEVRVDDVRGKLPCPFGHPGIYPKTNITLKNSRLHRTIYYTELNIHLIAEHGFYEGLGSGFRLDPTVLAEILEL